MCIRHIEDKREGQYQLIAKFIDTKIGSKIGNLGISSYMLFKLDYIILNQTIQSNKSQLLLYVKPSLVFTSSKERILDTSIDN